MLTQSVSDDAALYICLQNGRDTSIFANAQMFYPAAGVMLAFLLARRQGTPKRFLHPAHRGHCTDARHERSVCVSAAGGLAEYCKLCHHYRVVLGWIFLLTEKKTKARRLRSAPAWQIPDGVCHLRLFPCGQDRYGLSFDGDAGR